jgi:hypothetical protein
LTQREGKTARDHLNPGSEKKVSCKKEKEKKEKKKNLERGEFFVDDALSIYSQSFFIFLSFFFSFH